jgi:hypothetical protein
MAHNGTLGDQSESGGQIRHHLAIFKSHDLAKNFTKWGSAMKRALQGINTSSKPRANGCEECLNTGGWWLHLRRCAECGHIACCDSSPGQHAAKHAALMGHPIVASFEPLQNWFYDYRSKKVLKGPRLVGPRWRPETQPAPGPEGNVPANWESLLHDVA